jgi:ABC-type Fe3+/spermidine/putrescine transport system ATPase subunit
MLANGRLLQVGTPEQLYHSPSTREVAAFVAAPRCCPPSEWATVCG